MEVSAVRRLASLVCLTLFLLAVVCAVPSLATPMYYGIDPGVGPMGARPNSDAAAASFDAAAGAMGNLGIVNFESAPLGYFSGPLSVAPGVTVQMDAVRSTSGIRTGGSYSLGFNTTSGGQKYLYVAPNGNTQGSATFAFAFNKPVSAFGMYVTGLGIQTGKIDILYDDNSTGSLNVAGSPQGGALFVGFTSPEKKIKSFTISDPGGCEVGDAIGIDDVRYVTDKEETPPVPEPATMTLLGVGLLPMILRIRKRNQK